jgi:hypothetical protein
MMVKNKIRLHKPVIAVPNSDELVMNNAKARALEHRHSYKYIRFLSRYLYMIHSIDTKRPVI